MVRLIQKNPWSMGTGVQQWQQWIQELRSHYGSSIDRVKPYFEAAATFRSASERVQVPRLCSALLGSRRMFRMRQGDVSHLWNLWTYIWQMHRQVPQISMWTVWGFVASAASCRCRALAGGDERVLRCGFPVQPSQGGPQKYRDATGLRGAQGTGDLREIPGRATSFVQWLGEFQESFPWKTFGAATTLQSLTTMKLQEFHDFKEW